MSARRIAILGSTGSIGRQALELVAAYPERYEVVALTAHSNAALLFEQVLRFRPLMAGLTTTGHDIPPDLRFCQWVMGDEALVAAAGVSEAQDVLVSVVGMVGIDAVIAARKAGKRVLLANKEALVAGGDLVMSHCHLFGDDATLLPVDSEHAALYQCLLASPDQAFDKLILTASGGPFRLWDKERIRSATKADALRHPTWQMGQKITVDSASLFNKALEVIEAHYLYNAPPEKIDVIVHPESIVHSLVRFCDGSQLAQLAVPDMRLPIQAAMDHPQRYRGLTPTLDLAQVGTLQFQVVDTDRFPSMRLVRDVLAIGKSAPLSLNAANEVAVDAFLKDAIRFGQIYDVVEETLSRLRFERPADIEAIHHYDALARRVARESLASLKEIA